MLTSYLVDAYPGMDFVTTYLGDNPKVHIFANSEVSELDMTEGRDEKIVGLQISVNYSEGVKVLHRQNCFRKVKPEK